MPLFFAEGLFKDEGLGKKGKTVLTDEKPVFRGSGVDERAELFGMC